MTQDEKNKIERKFIAWALARDDDWWQEGHGAVSIWDVRIFIDFASELMAEQKRLILEEGKKSLDQTHKESKNWKALTDEEKTVYSAWEAAITDYQDRIKKI